MSVARAVGWGPEDRDGAPTSPRHGRSREGAGTCGCQGPLGPPRWPTWPGLRSTGCSCILGIRFRPEREIETEIQRREGGRGSRSPPPKEPARPHVQEADLCFPVSELNSAFRPSLLGGRRGGVQPPPPAPRPASSAVHRTRGDLARSRGGHQGLVSPVHVAVC